MAYAAVIDLGALDGDNGALIYGGSLSGIGHAVGAAGDIDGDGDDEILISTSSGQLNILRGTLGYALATDFNLGSAGSYGYVISGQATTSSVDGAGDVNGDGIGDIILGDASADAGAGRAYVVFGQQNAPASTSIADLDGDNGFTLVGVGAGDHAGTSVSAAGDINGDGFGDLIVGAEMADTNGRTDNGAAYVVFGKASFGAEVDLATLDGDDGFRIGGEADNDFAGYDVNGGGDINGDGFDDLIVSALSADGGDRLLSGVTYVIYGGDRDRLPSYDLSVMSASVGFQLVGANYFDASGASVDIAGDINGDGYSDMVIGAYGGDGKAVNNTGQTFVVFGKAASFGASFDLATLDGTNGFRVNGISADDASGSSVSYAGDWNGDGFDDILIGAPNADPGGDNMAGAAWLVFGKASGWDAEIDLADLDGTNGFRLDGIAANNVTGGDVSAAGDFNGDGLDDILIGAEGAARGGETYLIYGQAPGESVVRVGSVIGQTIFGSDFADTLSGLGGDDRLVGGSTGDLLVGGEGDDTLDGGGSNSDFAGYGGAAAGVTVDLSKDGAQNTVGAGTDTLIKIENLSGSSFGDTFTGDELANLINGLGGDDLLSGGDGVDKLRGGGGDDTLLGGAGDDDLDGGNSLFDVASYAGSKVAVSIDIGAKSAIGDGTDTLSNIEGAIGSDYNDLLTGGAKANVLDGGKGADFIIGGAAGDTLIGGGGADVFVYKATSDSKNSKADLIVDLGVGGDVIDLFVIDADGAKAGNGTFVIVDDFTGHRGELMLSYDEDTDLTAVLMDVSGDGEADMTIYLTGAHTDFDDFVL